MIEEVKVAIVEIKPHVISVKQKGKPSVLNTQLVRTGNEIIEQMYVDEVIAALDEVLALTSEQLRPFFLSQI